MPRSGSRQRRATPNSVRFRDRFGKDSTSPGRFPRRASVGLSACCGARLGSVRDRFGQYRPWLRFSSAGFSVGLSAVAVAPTRFSSATGSAGFNLALDFRFSSAGFSVRLSAVAYATPVQFPVPRPVRRSLNLALDFRFSSVGFCRAYGCNVRRPARFISATGSAGASTSPLADFLRRNSAGLRRGVRRSIRCGSATGSAGLQSPLTSSFLGRLFCWAFGAAVAPDSVQFLDRFGRA